MRSITALRLHKFANEEQRLDFLLPVIVIRERRAGLIAGRVPNAELIRNRVRHG